jgi:hypothetical protein
VHSLPEQTSRPGAHGSLLRLSLRCVTVALVAACAQQLLHEGTHGLTALALGARWEVWWFQATRWTSDAELAPWHVGVIKGLPTLVNLACAAGCVLFLSQRRAGAVSLLAFYFGAYSLLSGAGYLMFDPLFARQGSLGDWSQIVMLLGGSWAVRLPLIAAGVAGVLGGMYWIGNTGLRFVAEGQESEQGTLRLGLLLCALPYSVVNLLGTIAFALSPLPKAVFWASTMKYWLGYSGLVWGFLIRFVWSRPGELPRDPLRLPPRLSFLWYAVAVLVMVGIAIFLVPGVRLAPSR